MPSFCISLKEITMILFHLVPPTNISVGGRDEDWVEVDVIYSMNCEVDLVKPLASMIWRINEILFQAENFQAIEDQHGAYWLMGWISFKAVKGDDNIMIQCLITDKDNNQTTIGESDTTALEVLCKY